MTEQERIVEKMLRRASQPVPAGVPIIPDGPQATSQDLAELRRRCAELNYEIVFGASRAFTRQTHENGGLLHLEGRCSVGQVTDEFLHAWNNREGRRGRYFPSVDLARLHRSLRTLGAKSGSTDDRIFHQLEVANFAYCVRNAGESIPNFIWRTFKAL